MPETELRKHEPPLPEPRAEREPIPVWAEQLVYWLDTAIRVPGTEITIGLDAILGFLLPTAGDALTALGSLALFSLALRYRVPKLVIAKMLLNVAVDSLVGSVPLLGDVFDVFWRSNKKNLELIERYRSAPGAPARASDYIVVGLACLVLLALVLLPFVVAALVVSAVLHLTRAG
ncbi:MAG TPA: DUF4112 domain-containing protein [Polyangiaceae bacterium]|nr:DUF4112 domain-containing protein [Polyangiaceae bacterium]